MNVLGIDTSTALSTACVLRADGEAFEHVPDPAALGDPPGHSAELLPAVARVMDGAGLEFPELDAVAVGVGPGAYTGLRIGIASARALAHAAGVPLRPVGSLAALAAGIDAEAALPLIDARRGELFASVHVGGEERRPPFVSTPDALVETIRSDPDVPSAGLLAAGDGSLRFHDVLRAGSIEVAPAESPCHVVRALHVCRLAGPALAPEAVQPQYLRAPDAKPR